MSEVAIRDDADRREPTAEDGIEPGSEPESEPGSEPGVDLGAPGVAAMLALAAGAGGCSSGGGSGGGGGPAPMTVEVPTEPVAPAITSREEAARFLTQATFGPTEDEIDRLMAIGYDAWFQEQFNSGPSTQIDYLISLNALPIPPRNARIDAWWRNAMVGPDQLRQRMAFALSQIFVVSQNDLGSDRERAGLAHYYDHLTRGAFGNYREVLEEVTLSPIMGRYLSHIRNEKPDPARNIRPDENYAREVMQLFSIGLVELELDGTVRTDLSGDPIPTYDQAIIEGYAHVFTGWTYNDVTNWRRNGDDLITRMKAFEDFHDTGPKTLLGGVTLPAGRTAAEDLADALDSLFMHPNVAPFICRQLIQRFVTSNPTPAYVQRVAARFEDNGDGVRGDFKAVLRQLLLDDEARNGPTLMPTTFGKLKEPLLKQTQLWRAFRANAFNGLFQFGNPERDFGQAPLRAPSVFNFYPPDFRQPGPIDSAGLDSPEFAILTESTTTATTNRFYQHTFNRWFGRSNVDGDDVLINIDREMSLINDPDALLDRLSLLLLAGDMPADMRTILRDHINATSASNPADRVLETLYLIINSPDFAVQR